MKAVELKAQLRTSTGRGEVRKVRASGYLPGVIYGPGIDARPLAVPRHDLIRALHSHGMHALISLELDGSEYLALVKDVQVDPVRQEALHVDFQRVEENKPVHTETLVEIVGEPKGVKEGGVLEVQTRSISIAALPRAIPDSIPFDVSALQIGDSARVGDLTAPEGVTILTDPEETLLSVSAPTVEAAPTPELTEEEAAALAELPEEERAKLAEAAEAGEAPPAEEEGS